MAITNPRFINYARIHGRTPEEQLEHDRATYPGGVMVGFTLWNRARISEYSFINPAAFCLGALTDHEAYDAWLDGLPPEPKEPSINEMLAKLGIETRPGNGLHKELVMTATGESLGYFTASEALAYYHHNNEDRDNG